MTPLASLLLARGDRVTGSDGPLYPPMSDRLAALGIAVLPAWAPENVGADVGEVVAGNLARKDNAEVLEAVRRGLRVRSMPETLHDEILQGRHPVVVAGTHGKTTTTALAAWLLASAGRDPGYLVGGEPVNFPGPAALGTGRPFVVEGDEYSTSYADKGPKFLHYAPRTFVLTSVEFDHADLYPDLAAVKDAFRAGIAIVPRDGRIVANADDPNVRDVLGEGARASRSTRSKIRRPTSSRETSGRRKRGVSSRCCAPESLFVAGSSPLSGRHNVSNALAAVSVGLEFSLSPEDLAAGLASFRGVPRRMQVVGTAGGVTVVDDFAHHPTAVATTLAGAKKRFPGRRVWAAFEPRSMTAGRADFLEAYAEALGQADAVALAAPFHAARLAQPDGPGALDAQTLVARLRALGKPALTAATPDALLVALLSGAARGRRRPRDVVRRLRGVSDYAPARLLERALSLAFRFHADDEASDAEIRTSTRCPAASGPTPAGVPVRITSPGSSVMRGRRPRDEGPDVEEHVRRRSGLPERPVHERLEDEARGSTSVSIAGPSGQNVSKPFARHHWPSVFWRSRAVTSSAHVTPRTTSRHRSFGTRRARAPITRATSPSYSTRALSLGRRIVPPCPITEDGGLRKTSGSFGRSWPSSAACAL